jgi:hypothetical protein
MTNSVVTCLLPISACLALSPPACSLLGNEQIGLVYYELYEMKQFQCTAHHHYSSASGTVYTTGEYETTIMEQTGLRH